MWLARAADGIAVALKLGGTPQPPDTQVIDGLVPVLASGVSEGTPFQVMPLLAGRPLSERLAHGPLEPTERRGIIEALAAILERLHATGRAHGDVRIGNVVLDPVTLLDRELRMNATPEGDREALARLATALS